MRDFRHLKNDLLVLFALGRYLDERQLDGIVWIDRKSPGSGSMVSLLVRSVFHGQIDGSENAENAGEHRSRTGEK